ncbi:MAG: DUF2235 domain-containing protein [Elainellaceae cyanobacterium]
MKRLVVCCDGTWQKLTADPTTYPTNVVKLAQAVKPLSKENHEEIQQVIFYNPGVGTRNFIDRIGGGAFGWGVDEVIQNAYKFLCWNYDPDENDQIYLFGFSRGAYTVRSLAGLIYNSGLLKRRHIRRVLEAYKLYRSEIKPQDPSAIDFREKYSRGVDVDFLGCWDTVGSLGVPEVAVLLPLDRLINQRYRFHDTTLNRRIRYARHAVAIDENRTAFDVTPMQLSEGADTNLREMWFPGHHGCVGGGTKATEGLSNAALQWLMDESHALGLSFDLAPVAGVKENELITDYKTHFEKPLQGILEKLRGNVREISTPDMLHLSTRQRWCALDGAGATQAYRPENLTPFTSYLEDWCQSEDMSSVS